MAGQVVYLDRFTIRIRDGLIIRRDARDRAMNRLAAGSPSGTVARVPMSCSTSRGPLHRHTARAPRSQHRHSEEPDLARVGQV